MIHSVLILTVNFKTILSAHYNAYYNLYKTFDVICFINPAVLLYQMSTVSVTDTSFINVKKI